MARWWLRVRDTAFQAAAGMPFPPSCRRMMRLWFALAWPAFTAVLAIFWLMVAKAVLW